MISLVLKILAALCFAFLVFGVEVGDVKLLPLGLLLWVLSELLPVAVVAVGTRRTE